MRGTQSVPWPPWLWLPFANRRDLAIDQRLMAAQQLWLGSTNWPLQPDFILGVFKKTFHSHQESLVVLGSSWGSCCHGLCPFHPEPACPSQGQEDGAPSCAVRSRRTACSLLPRGRLGKGRQLASQECGFASLEQGLWLWQVAGGRVSPPLPLCGQRGVQ